MDKISIINNILKEVVDKDIYYSKRISLENLITPNPLTKAFNFNENDEVDTLKCFILFGDYAVHEVLYINSESLVADALDRAVERDKSGFVFRCICMEYFVFIGHYLSTDFSLTLYYDKSYFNIEANRLIKILNYIKYRYIKQCGMDLSTSCFTNEINQLKEWYKKD